MFDLEGGQEGALTSMNTTVNPPPIDPHVRIGHVSVASKQRAGTAPFWELRRHGLLPIGGGMRTSAGRLPHSGMPPYQSRPLSISTRTIAM